jgi:hypothetical protein
MTAWATGAWKALAWGNNTWVGMGTGGTVSDDVSHSPKEEFFLSVRANYAPGVRDNYTPDARVNFE